MSEQKKQPVTFENWKAFLNEPNKNKYWLLLLLYFVATTPITTTMKVMEKIQSLGKKDTKK